MPSVNYRGVRWINEEAEHDEQDELRANALARRWSELHHQIEQEGFERDWRREEGGDYEPPECNTCGRVGFVGLEYRYPAVFCTRCMSFPQHVGMDLVGITCPDCNGDGYDKSGERAKRQFEADRNLEIELLEDKLAAMGARMMRPYEHWNEDEQLMEYLERER